jgi:CHAD domain-containing protein
MRTVSTGVPDRERSAAPSAPGPVAAVVRDALDTSVQRLLAADPIARVGDDPEGVHQARVATRRLRCDLRTFAPLLDHDWATSLRNELRWLGAELGVAREAEVLLGHLRERTRALAPEIRCDVGTVLDAALGDRDAAGSRVLEVLRSSRYLDLVDRLVQGAMAPRMDLTAGSATTTDLTRLARRPWQRLARAYTQLGSDPSDHSLHTLRILVKRVRYAVEAVAGAIGGERPRRLAGALTDLQTVLGDHQDAVVAQAWLREHVARVQSATNGAANRNRAGGPTIYAAGMLAGLLRTDALAAADALPDAWSHASGRRLRSWM